MPLTKLYIAAVIKDFQSNSDGPCRRCGTFHNIAKCSAKPESCYGRGLSDLSKEQWATGQFKENVKEAEELWKDQANKVKAEKEAKDAKKKKEAIERKAAEKAEEARKAQEVKKAHEAESATPKLGQIKQIPTDSTIDAPPKLVKFGIRFQPPAITPKGPKILVRSNYVKVSKMPQKLYVYSLKFFRPTEKSGRFVYNKRREIGDAFHAMKQSDIFDLQKNKKQYVTDFKKIWCTTPILDVKDLNTTKESGDFDYIQPNGKPIKNLRADICLIDILEDIEQKLRQTHLAELHKYIEALNAYVAECIEDNQKNTQILVNRVGANRFFLEKGYVAMKGLRAGRGYFTSIRPGSDGTLLNINPATSAFLPPVTVARFMGQIGNQRWKSQEKYISQLLHGATVRILYQRDSFDNSDIDYNSEAAQLKIFTQFGLPANEQRFFKMLEKKDNMPRKSDPEDAGMSVLEYFENIAKVPFDKAEDKKYPERLVCVNVGKRVRTDRRKNETREELMREQSERGAQWIPAFLLYIMPGQVVKTSLSGDHTSQMMTHALRLPAENAGLIEEEGLRIIAVKGSNGVQQPLASKDFQVSQDLVEVPATKLDQPILRFANKSTTPTQGRWNLNGVGFAKCAQNLGHLHMLALPGCFKDTEDPLTRAHAMFLKHLSGHGLNFQARNDKDTTTMDEQDNQEETNEQIVKRFLKASRGRKEATDCSIILISEKDYDLYAFGKVTADDEGQQTLFAVGSKFFPKKGDAKQFMSNLALKVNMKFGGESHHFMQEHLNKYLRGSDVRNSTIILGADIGHSGVGGKMGSPSVACVVGSVDNNFMRYPGSMRLQRGGQENIESDHLYSMVQHRLRDWRAEHNDQKWPTHMLFYRDGISESQFQACIDDEIATVKQAFADLCEKELKLTFVICGKRHHTRFYATRAEDSYSETQWINGKGHNVVNGNLDAGLLVTDVVTNPVPFNFFLQSHRAIKGTARSAHYHVLEDGMGIGETNLPKLTMMLCYAFSRATTGVSYVAPAYIADRLCERGRVYLRRWALDSDMEPKFEIPMEEGADDKLRRAPEDQVEEAKAAFAQNLADNEDVWGEWYNKEHKGGPWLDPWHPRLGEKNGMFWL